MKLGRKAVTDHMVVYLNKTNESHPFMFGLVVGKTVGNAVERNLVKRRARAAIQTRMQNFQPGETLVVRALPGLSKISWDDLCEELDHNIARVKN
jgi:ribonuclease P protein component